MSVLPHSRAVTWFTAIGALAALVHYVTAVSLEANTSLTPAWANVSGFLLAFPVSYVGHQKLSFAAHQTPHQHALPRFLVIACVGFLVNQFLLLSSIGMFGIPFWLALGIVMVVVAVATYLLSCYWAFRKH